MSCRTFPEMTHPPGRHSFRDLRISGRKPTSAHRRFKNFASNYQQLSLFLETACALICPEAEMATKKQMKETRRNAQKSTGPKTEEGKMKPRLNSIKHGLGAIHVPLPHENLMEFHD